jgi:hypothetical protein
MKIYFGFTVAGDRSAVDTARQVVELLERMGHEVLTRHLVSDNPWEADRSITAQEVFQRDMGWLKQCDLFIAEVSGSFFDWDSRLVICWGQRAREWFCCIAVTWRRGCRC